MQYFKQQLESRAHPLSDICLPDKSADESIPRIFIAAKAMKSVSETPKQLENGLKNSLVDELNLESEERKSAKAKDHQGLVRSEPKKLSVLSSMQASSSQQSGYHSSDCRRADGLMVVDNVLDDGMLDGSQGNISVDGISEQ